MLGHETSIQKTLWPLVKGDKDLSIALPDDSLFPSDHMDIRPIRDFIFPAIDKVRSKAANNPSLQALCNYLSKVKQWYEIWNDNEKEIKKSMEQKLQLMEEITNYFQTQVSNCRTFALSRAPETFKNLKQIWTFLKWPADAENSWRLGHFGTNVVENYFSQIRMKNVCVVSHE